MPHRYRPRRDRIAAATLVAAVHAALLLLALSGRAPPRPVSETMLKSFDVATPPPPPAPAAERPRPARARSASAQGAPGRAARRTETVAPLPIVPPPPAPLVAATVAGDGAAAVGGAVTLGTGTGALGTATASGAGSGGGGGTRARLLTGTIRDGDYPRAERAARIEGAVTVAFVVGIDGRAGDCRVTRTSGNAALDATTCRLILARFRYAPATDAAGRPRAEEHGWRQRWWIGEGDADPGAAG